MSACPSANFSCGSSPANTDNTLRLGGTSPRTCLTQSTKLLPSPLCVTNKIPVTDHSFLYQAPLLHNACIFHQPRIDTSRAAHFLFDAALFRNGMGSGSIMARPADAVSYTH